jgi:hypothetical protein
MKKIQYLAIFAAALLTLTTGCKKEETGEKVDVTFEVVIAKEAAKADDGTKVYLDNDLYPNWNSDAPIRVNNGDGFVTPNTSNTTRGTFTATIDVATDGKYYAVFPASAAKNGSIGYDLHANQKVCLPRVQQYETYDDNGNIKQKINAPMFAYTETGNSQTRPVLQFHNLCGVMKITVTNDKAWDMILDSIQVEAKTKRLSGEFSITSPTSEEPYVVATTNAVDSFNVTARQSNIVSLAGIAKYLHSTLLEETTDADNSIDLYVYLPTIPSSDIANNLFYIRVFSHPVWRSSTTDTPPYDAVDNEVHISYEMRQTNSSYAYVNRNNIIPISLSLASCKPTFTSLKAFTVSGGTTPTKVSISRGNAQYYIKTYTGPNTNNAMSSTGHWRFSPRQWAFLMYPNMNTSVYAATNWIEHFTWDSGTEPTRHYDAGSIPVNMNIDFTTWHGDWGANFTNVTSNSVWRSLGHSEMDYLLKTRVRRSDLSNKDNFAWVLLRDAVPVSNEMHSNELFGIVVLPDAFDWSRADLPTQTALGFANNYNFKCYSGNSGWSDNTTGAGDVATRYRNDNPMTTSQFEYLEAKGCILIPCIGVYTGVPSNADGNDLWTENQPEGGVWTKDYHSANDAYTLMISADTPSGATDAGRADCRTNSDSECYRRLNVRLVRAYVEGGSTYKYDPFQ